MHQMRSGMVIAGSAHPEVQALIYEPGSNKLYKLPKNIDELARIYCKEPKDYEKLKEKLQWSHSKWMTFDTDENDVVRRYYNLTKNDGARIRFGELRVKIVFSPRYSDRPQLVHSDFGRDLQGRVKPTDAMIACPNVPYFGLVKVWVVDDERQSISIQEYSPQIDYLFHGFEVQSPEKDLWSPYTAVYFQPNVEPIDFVASAPWNRDVHIIRHIIDHDEGPGGGIHAEPSRGYPKVKKDRYGFFVDDRELFLPYFPDTVCKFAVVGNEQRDGWLGAEVIGHVYKCNYFSAGCQIMYKLREFRQQRFPYRIGDDGSKQFLFHLVKHIDERTGYGCEAGIYYNHRATAWVRDPNDILRGAVKTNAWIKLDRVPDVRAKFVVVERDYSPEEEDGK